MTKSEKLRVTTLAAAASMAALLVAVLWGATKPAEAAFPGPNGRIAFVSNKSILTDDPDITDYEIFTMNPGGSGIKQLTKNSVNESDPAWHPEGSGIAYVSYEGGDPEIWITSSDGTFQAPLTNNTTTDSAPAWSPELPDGSHKITFERRLGGVGNRDIFVMDTDITTDDETNITNKPRTFDSDPVWSPNGRKIAFSSDRDGDFEIFTMNADGDNPIKRTRNNNADDYQPNWSPGGTHIAFTSDRDGGAEIFVMKANGDNQTNITANTAWDNQPAWSPDGKQIAFTSDRIGGFEDIFVMKANGDDQRSRTDDPNSFDSLPDWGPKVP